MTAEGSSPRDQETPASLLARLQAGTLSWRQVQLAAALGNEAARVLADPAADEDPVRAALDELGASSQRLLACDEAERLLAKTAVIDERCWDAIGVARRYARGASTCEELAAADETARAAFLELNALVLAVAEEDEDLRMAALLQVTAGALALRATAAPSLWPITWAAIAADIRDETRADAREASDSTAPEAPSPEELRSRSAIRRRQLARLAESLLRAADSTG